MCIKFNHKAKQTIRKSVTIEQHLDDFEIVGWGDFMGDQLNHHRQEKHALTPSRTIRFHGFPPLARLVKDL